MTPSEQLILASFSDHFQREQVPFLAAQKAGHACGVPPRRVLLLWREACDVQDFSVRTV